LQVENGSLLLTVEDDGRGITDDEIHATTSLGLLGLRERARLLGGETTIRRRDTRGTIIEVALPLATEQTAGM
jgi:signal transduction histidine kinase